MTLTLNKIKASETECISSYLYKQCFSEIYQPNRSASNQ